MQVDRQFKAVCWILDKQTTKNHERTFKRDWNIAALLVFYQKNGKRSYQICHLTKGTVSMVLKYSGPYNKSA